MSLPRVLIVGEKAVHASVLLGKLDSWAYDLHLVAGCLAALSALKEHSFGLVLSQLTLSDGTADRFFRPLRGTSAHMFFCNVLDNDSWWLHVLDRGENRWWKPRVLPPADFLIFLDRCIHQDRPADLASFGIVCQRDFSDVRPFTPGPKLFGEKP